MEAHRARPAAGSSARAEAVSSRRLVTRCSECMPFEGGIQAARCGVGKSSGQSDPVQTEQGEQTRSGDDHVAVEGQGARELSVKKSGQGASGAAGGAGRDLKQVAPQAQVRSTRPSFGRQQAKDQQRRQQDDPPRYSPRKEGHPSLPKRVALSVGKFVHGNQDDVHQFPDATPAQSHKLEDAEARVAQIKAVES